MKSTNWRLFQRITNIPRSRRNFAIAVRRSASLREASGAGRGGRAEIAYVRAENISKSPTPIFPDYN